MPHLHASSHMDAAGGGVGVCGADLQVPPLTLEALLNHKSSSGQTDKQHEPCQCPTSLIITAIATAATAAAAVVSLLPRTSTSSAVALWYVAAPAAVRKRRRRRASPAARCAALNS